MSDIAHVPPGLLTLEQWDALELDPTRRWELSEGTLTMSPRPQLWHQRISKRLTRLLDDHRDRDQQPGEVLREVERLLDERHLLRVPVQETEEERAPQRIATRIARRILRRELRGGGARYVRQLRELSAHVRVAARAQLRHVGPVDVELAASGRGARRSARSAVSGARRG